MTSVVEKRASPRYRSEVVVSFFDGETEATGLTWDVSVGGMFIRTNRMPEVGRKLMIRMRFSEDRQLLVQGRVVRSFQAPPFVRHLFPTGFGLEISGSELYRNYVRSVEAGATPQQA